jgi:aminodeoxyfutalosine synthase
VPLSHADGLALFQHPNLMEVGALANEVRERLHGDRTYFNRNLHINPTNVCVASCKLCSFSRRHADAEGPLCSTSSKRWTSCAPALPPVTA